jgi:hypothetical protein
LLPESVPPTESVPCDSEIPLWHHLHKCTELEGVPRNSHQFRNYNLHGLNYEWLVLGIDRIPLRNSRNWQQFLGIPRIGRSS